MTELVYCWKETGRVHIMLGDKCACLMPSIGMIGFSTELPKQLNRPNCISCKDILNAQKRFSDKKIMKLSKRRAKQKQSAKHFKKTGQKLPVKGGFYNSSQWRALRYKVLKASKGCCELCGSGPTKEKPLHVDHIKPRSKFPDLDLDINNCQVMCFDCNMGKGNTDTTDWRFQTERDILRKLDGWD
jgi:5-methylcytosine-specific restriction endonuclease McrA